MRAIGRTRLLSLLLVVPLVAVVPAAAAEAGDPGISLPTPASGTATVPLLTGGLLTLKGAESSVFDWHDDQGNGWNMSASLDGVSNSYLMPVDYPGTPQLPANNYPDDYPPGDHSEALSWSATLGSESAEEYGVDSNNQHFDYTCQWTVSSGGRPFTIAPVFPQQQAWAPTYGLAPPLTNPQCSNPDKPVQGAPLEAGSDGGRLTLPAKPVHATSLQLPITKQVDPCAAGVFPNCTGHDDFTGSVTLSCLLCVTDISFRQLKDPSTNDSTLTDVPDTGTYDGNTVEIDATVHNVGDTAITTPVYFLDGDHLQWLVPDNPADFNPLAPVNFPAHSTTHVTMEWNTTGYAWQNDKPHSTRRVEVMTPLGSAYRDITVLPKPVVLVHGWNAHADTWDGLKSELRAENPEWRGYAVGDNPTWSAQMNTGPVDGTTISANAFQMGKYIESLRSHLGAQHVDVVAHSMGGLISRFYIDRLMPHVPQPPGNRPVVSHLLMLGTPNQGSPCAVPFSTVTGLFGDAIPTYQLRPDYIDAVFDKSVTNQNGVPFSVMAGYGYALLCNPAATGDMVVTVKSAWWNYSDVDKTFARHTQLTDDPVVLKDFIEPRLAVSPPIIGAAPQGRPFAAPTARSSVTRSRRGVASGLGASSAADQVAAAARTTVAGRSSHTLTVRVPSGASRLTAVFTAPSTVSAAMVSPSGKTVVTQAAGGAAADQPMRGISVGKPVAGTWKVVFRDASSSPAGVLVGAMIAGGNVALHAASAQDAKHRLLISASLGQGGRLLRGAVVTADVRGTPTPLPPIRLVDDGKHQDGAAGDGRYGAVTGPLAPGHYLVVITAARGSTKRMTSVVSR